MELTFHKVFFSFLPSSAFSSINNALPDIVSYFVFHLIPCLLHHGSFIKEELSLKKKCTAKPHNFYKPKEIIAMSVWQRISLSCFACNQN